MSDNPRTMSKDDIKKDWALEPPPNTEEMQFDVVFKRGAETVATVHGHPMPFGGFRVGDVTDRIIETEQYLERLTGLRVHIQTAQE